MMKMIYLVGLVTCASISLRAEGPSVDGAKISSITGLAGNYNAQEGVFKITAPRNDVPIKVDRWKMPPFMGLTSWAAFSAGQKLASMVMGDLVLFEDEVNPVLSAALRSGLEVTALHNHFFYDDPKVFFMHIAGEGSVETLAQGVRACLDASKAVRAKQKKPAKSFGHKGLPAKSTITAAEIEKVFEVKGEAKDGMYKVVIGRDVKMACGCNAGKDMGVNTWAAFAGSDDNALVDGDFAVLENELQAVLKSLRAGGINIVAIHHHMVGESPRMLFLHYWGRGSAPNLAKSVKAALVEQKKGQLTKT